MTSSKREILVGILMVLGFAGLLGTSYWASNVPQLGVQPGYLLEATFNAVDGIETASEVRLSGIRVGRIERMRLTPEYRARVWMRIESGVEVPADTAAAIHTDGLFGSKYVELQPGGEERVLAHGDTITYTQDSLIVSELLDRIIAQGRARLAREREGAKD
jgi:phospholipid/cholesterol/gamma-HCH transport system substrate-binding protein